MDDRLPSTGAAPRTVQKAGARRLMRGRGRAALATALAADGRPYASLAAIAFDHDASPLLLLSRLADHTRNLEADPRLSLLFDGTGGLPNPQAGPRVTVMGRARPSAEPRHRARFLARHPGAALYAGFADFAVWRVEVERMHHVAGFARAVWLDGDAGVAAATAAALAESEPGIIEHMNADHAEAVDLYARRLLKRRRRGWRLAGVDCDGCDLARGDEVLRLDFAAPVADADGVRAALVGLARAARAAGSDREGVAPPHPG